MAPLEVPPEYKAEVDKYTSEIKSGILTHQALYKKLQEEPNNTDLQKSLKEWEAKIYAIGLEGKKIFERLRKEYKICQKNGKKTLVRNGIEERRANVNNALGRARKQNIITRPTSVQSSSSEGSPSGVSSPEPTERPIVPHDLSQEQFLRNCFNLLTHVAAQDLQHRRVERKRRSTTNPLYVYTKEWNATTIQANTKRKRASPPSAAVHRRGRGKKRSRSPSPDKESPTSPLPNIPNLPSGLTIERVAPGDMTKCIECGLTGTLQECETCRNGFHVSCHNRILSQSPKHCPKCFSKDRASNSSAMTVMTISPEIAEKIEQKKLLQDTRKNLDVEYSKLKEKHALLMISLKNQKSEREELISHQVAVETKIEKLTDFIKGVKEHNLPPDQQHEPEEIEVECS